MSTHLHVSDISQFRSCRIRWLFSSPLQMGLEPKYTKTTLWRGTLIHEALETWYLMQQNNLSENKPSMHEIWEGVWESANFELRRNLGEEEYAKLDDELKELNVECVRILAQYLHTMKEDDKRYKILGVEHLFDIELNDQFVLSGKMDLVLEDAEGTIWIMDHKITRGDFFDFGLWLTNQSEQAKAYVFAAQRLYPGRKIGGIIFNMVRSIAPNIPNFLVSGKSLSKAKNQGTSAFFYRRTILSAGFDEADYVDFLDTIDRQEQTKPWALRYPISFSEQTLQYFAESLLKVGAEMTKQEILLGPASFTTCKSCNFRTPCGILLNQGVSAALPVLQNEFRPSKYSLDAQQAQLDFEQN